MTTRPLLIDAFCCIGGAGMGYHRAGFEVVGIDIRPQPHYPFRFVRGDVLELLPRMIEELRPAAVHASPPCQAHSILLAGRRETRARHLDLIAPVRELLAAAGVPYVIENVPRAPLRSPVMLCGTMFGLGAVCDDGRYRQLQRHRLFEVSGFTMTPPGGCQHRTQALGVYGKGRWNNLGSNRRGGYQGSAGECRLAMGIGWGIVQGGVNQAIPPAYTEHIGRQLLAWLGLEAAA